MKPFSLTKSEIVGALILARKGISQYLELMALFPSVDVSADPEFQRQYNHFYRVRQKPTNWYRSYFRAMQELRTAKPLFADVLDRLRDEVGSCEASFSSKLVATLDPSKPVWDSFVLNNMGIPPLRTSSPHRFDQAKKNYARIEEWYELFLASENGRAVVRAFDEIVPQHGAITDLKKVDFVLWQTRPVKTEGPEPELF
jgi:hypothetical protein